MSKKKVSRTYTPVILFDGGGAIAASGGGGGAAAGASAGASGGSGGGFGQGWSANDWMTFGQMASSMMNSGGGNGQQQPQKKSYDEERAWLDNNALSGMPTSIAGAAFQAVDQTGQMLSALDRLFKKERRPMGKTIGLYCKGGRLFEGGGSMGASGGGGDAASAMSGIAGGMGIGNTVLTLVGNAVQQAKIKDTDEIKEGIQNAQTKGQQKGDTFDTLMRDWQSQASLNHISAKDLRDKSILSDFADGLSASAQGASAGAMFGPWGAAIGGIIGGVSSNIGSIVGRVKASKEAKRVNQQIDQTNSFNERSLSNRAENLAQRQGMEALANFSAFGGPLGFGEYPVMGAIDYELAQRRLQQKEVATQGGGTSTPQIYAIGGPLHSHGGDWTNGVVIIDAGGTHEQNPHEGVQMGVNPEGIPNLVEEGEVVYKDYVFSNRIAVPEEVIEKYKLKGAKDMTFADAVKRLQKASAERPNDPIEKRGLDDILGKLANEQERVRQEEQIAQAKKFAKGGKLGILFSGPGGMPQYLYEEEEEEPVYGKNGPIIFDIDRENPSPAYTKSGQLEYTSAPVVEGVLGNGTDTGDNGKGSNNNNKDKTNWMTYLRYAPALGAGLGVFSDLMGWTNTPDFSSSEMVLGAADGLRDATYKPIGDYLAYTPLDRLFYVNQLAGQAGATRRAILNNTGLNRGVATAGLLAADYNAQAQLGNLFRQAEEYNLNQRERVATFNRATNMFNSEQDLKAQQLNQGAHEARIRAAAEAARLRDAAIARASAGRSANLTNLFNSIGDIGREEFARDMVNTDPSKYYTIGRDGKVHYKTAYNDLPEEEKKAVQLRAESEAKAASKGKSKGGYINIGRI